MSQKFNTQYRYLYYNASVKKLSVKIKIQNLRNNVCTNVNKIKEVNPDMVTLKLTVIQ